MTIVMFSINTVVLGNTTETGDMAVVPSASFSYSTQGPNFNLLTKFAAFDNPIHIFS